MIDSTTQMIVQTNCGEAAEARAIARAEVEAGLAACGNVHGPVVSIYRWQGELVETQEFVLVLKTSRACLGALEPLIRAHHSYELPAILVLPIQAGDAAYLDWLARESPGSSARSD